MIGNVPPRLVTWLLEHLVPSASGGRALVGDLQEEFHRGRSRAWYWRQALFAVLFGYLAVLDRLRLALFFAMLWSAATPLVIFKWYTSRAGSELFVYTVPYPWPWSACAQLGMAFVLMMTFLCTGLFLYLLLHSLVARSMRWGHLGRAVLSAAAVRSATTACRTTPAAADGSSVAFADPALRDPRALPITGLRSHHRGSAASRRRFHTRRPRLYPAFHAHSALGIV